MGKKPGRNFTPNRKPLRTAGASKNIFDDVGVLDAARYAPDWGPENLAKEFPLAPGPQLRFQGGTKQGKTDSCHLWRVPWFGWCPPNVRKEWGNQFPAARKTPPRPTMNLQNGNLWEAITARPSLR
ncbi:uncharacterized protein TM35_000013500 [Trypanosoma theileri]|uniref:Uncharacterized protein n=1 Tax=Trypanosoma theileri TaxID=67003 RepID=A0A1X0PA18_9TRYP|nr:uncharacterized protein TM35_000013500 [Trypanosoma theileri]ORC93473.1 hypothetical protein TM35_000013500 [Trypanosoma theileri]